MKISACLIIRNEEKVLGRCLESLKTVVDEIVVVHDGPCDDRSIDISRKYNARIYLKPLIGEAEYYRPFAYTQTTGEWILQIDADEFLSEEAKAKIPKLINSRDADAYSFSWPYFSGGQYIHDGPFAKTLKPCLLRKEKMYMIGISHEYPRTYGNLQKRKDILLEHKPSYDNFTEDMFEAKWTKWAKLQAEQISHIEKAPLFNISDPSDTKIFRYYKFMGKYPVISGIQETIRFLLIYLSRGILWSGRQSIRIAYFELRYLWLIRKYLIKQET